MRYKDTTIGFRAVTKPEVPEAEPTPTKREKAEEAVQYALAGTGSVRRIFLYVVAGALVLTPIAPAAIIPLVLLVATDEYH